MENQEKVERLYFELASESRISILQEIEKHKGKMREIARKLDLTTTETFRQLQRLADALLIQKEPGGNYIITEYGTLILRLSGTFEFLYKHRKFFSTREFKRLPTQFLDRIGELSQAEFSADMMANINVAERISALDRVPIGYPTIPEIIYGFGLSAGYKGFDFSFFFQGLANESFWIDAVKTSPFIDTDGDNTIISKNALLNVYADDHWTEQNRDIYALWPRLSDRLMENNTQRSTWFMRDGSFLRLKSLEMGYSLPKKAIAPLSITNLRIYASGTNLLTFSKFKLWDPEMAGNGLGYPIQKVFNVGLQLSF